MAPENRLNRFIYAAIAGCVVAFASDLLMLAVPASGIEYFTTYKSNMIHVSFLRLSLGNTIGVAFIPLELFGFWALYQMIKQSGSAIPLLVFLCLSFSMIAGIAYHACFAFYGTGLKAHMLVNNESTKMMMDNFNAFHDVFYKMMGLFFGLGSVLFTIQVVISDTVFKKWHAVFNPLFILILVRFVLSAIPSPAGGYIAPGYGNLTNGIFFVFLLMVSRDKKGA